MVREEQRTTCIASIDTNQWPLDYVHLAARINVTYGQMWISYSLNGNIVPAKLLLLIEKCTLTFSKSVKLDYNQIFPNGYNNHIGRTKISSVRSRPDPPIIKKIAVRSSPGQPKLASVLFQSDPVLTRARLWSPTQQRPNRDDRIVDIYYPILFLKNDISIPSESCFGGNHTICIQKLSKSVLWCTTYIFVLCLFCLVRQNKCWSHFAFSWTWLVKVVTWQV